MLWLGSSISSFWSILAPTPSSFFPGGALQAGRERKRKRKSMRKVKPFFPSFSHSCTSSYYFSYRHTTTLDRHEKKMVIVVIKRISFLYLFAVLYGYMPVNLRIVGTSCMAKWCVFWFSEHWFCCCVCSTNIGVASFAMCVRTFTPKQGPLQPFLCSTFTYLVCDTIRVNTVVLFTQCLHVIIPKTLCFWAVHDRWQARN